MNKVIELNNNEIVNFRKTVSVFESMIKEIPGAMIGDNNHCPLKHSFAEGMYVREIFIPKGTCLTGKIHKHSHPNFLLKGEVIVVTEFKGRERLKAPMSIISEPGTKRVVYALEDTIWVTVHLNLDDKQDLEKIENYVIAKSYEEIPHIKPKVLELEEKKLCLG